jgi:L-malate glycosyltransferase
VLKIAHIDTGQCLAGGQWQLLLLARQLRRRGHQQWIVCPQGSELDSRARSESFPVLWFRAADPGHVRGAIALRRLLKSQRLDILHAHDGRGQSIAWLSSWGTNARTVASRRVTFLPRWRTLHTLKYRHTCDAVIAVSNYVKSLLLACGVPGGMIEVIYDGIVLPERRPDAEQQATARRRWGFEDGDFVVGSVGTFRREKGYDSAIQAATKLNDRRKIKWMFCVSRGSAEESQHFAMLKATPNFRVVQTPEDPAELLNALDLYVMPSLAEGLGSSALLAMAYGLPVAASRTGGLPEIVDEGKNGWLFAPGSASELAQVVVRAFENSKERHRFAANAYYHARQYSDDIMASRTEALYMKLMGGIKKHVAPS